MRLLLNVIWVVFGGFWLCLGYILFGLIALIPIVILFSVMQKHFFAGVEEGAVKG